MVFIYSDNLTNIFIFSRRYIFAGYEWSIEYKNSQMSRILKIFCSYENNKMTPLVDQWNLASQRFVNKGSSPWNLQWHFWLCDRRGKWERVNQKQVLVLICRSTRYRGDQHDPRPLLLQGDTGGEKLARYHTW